MADFTVLSDSQLDPDAPLTSELAYAWRDNPIAIAEGASGAPRISDAALSATVTAAGRGWVANRYGEAVLGSKGQLALARFTSSGSGNTITYGAQVDGSELRPASVDASVSGSTFLSGTWRCLGYAVSGATASSVTLWQRVA